MYALWPTMQLRPSVACSRIWALRQIRLPSPISASGDTSAIGCILIKSVPRCIRAHLYTVRSISKVTQHSERKLSSSRFDYELEYNIGASHDAQARIVRRTHQGVGLFEYWLTISAD